MSNLTVAGGGAWGTALAIQAARAGCTVTLVVRDTAAIPPDRRNPRLPSAPIPASITITGTIPTSCDLIIWAVPMQFLRAALCNQPAPSVVCAKGVERGTNLLPLEVLRDAGITGPAAYLSGPNFAHEIAAGLPAAAVVASEDTRLRDQVQAMLASDTFRLYGNADPIGAQIGGAAKNVIAIAAGAVIGAGLGENARAALVTRGLSELRRLAVAAGGQADTVMGLSGLGDLLLTCTGTSSRNFRLGHALASGQALTESLAQSGGVVEGVATASGLLARANGVELPICKAVADFLDGSQTVGMLMKQLLGRPPKDE